MGGSNCKSQSTMNHDEFIDFMDKYQNEVSSNNNNQQKEEKNVNSDIIESVEDSEGFNQNISEIPIFNDAHLLSLRSLSNESEYEENNHNKSPLSMLSMIPSQKYCDDENEENKTMTSSLTSPPNTPSISPSDYNYKRQRLPFIDDGESVDDQCWIKEGKHCNLCCYQHKKHKMETIKPQKYHQSNYSIKSQKVPFIDDMDIDLNPKFFKEIRPKYERPKKVKFELKNDGLSKYLMYPPPEHKFNAFSKKEPIPKRYRKKKRKLEKLKVFNDYNDKIMNSCCTPIRYENVSAMVFKEDLY